ncbi:MAG: Uma2 family endonuclease [Pirellulaceae bacterium]|nr:Uma2 family endonuclease [Pirellulaceae bacterium]
MSHTSAQWTTAEQLAAMHSDEQRYELVAGAVRMMSPAGFRHGRIAGKLLRRIGDHVERHELGETCAAETGFLLTRDPDTVRAADVAFVSRQRLGKLIHHAGYLPLAPDLVAEVLSPNDRQSDVDSRIDQWLAAGVRIVLVVAPSSATILVRRPSGDSEAYTSGQVDLGDALPGFQLDVDDLFA